MLTSPDLSPPLVIIVAWLLFGGSHLLLSRQPVRTRLVERLGERQFVVLYAGVSGVTILFLAMAGVCCADRGPQGLALGDYASMRWVLGTIAFAGAALAGAGIMNYSQSAVAILGRRSRRGGTVLKQPLHISAIDRLSRHPFFVGFALLMLMHVFFASHLAGALFFAGFAVLATIGIPIQDRKLLKKHPSAYEAYVRGTSILPRSDQFKPSSSVSVLPAVTRSAVLALVLFMLHPVWEIGYGAIFLVLLMAGAVFAVFRAIRRESASKKS